MFGKANSLVLVFLLITLSLSGCLSDSSSSDIETVSEAAETTFIPCSEPSASVTQTMVSITVNGEERFFRLSAPSSDAGTKLAVIIAFHGGGGAEEDFQQQSEFDQLGEQEKFIMAYAIAEDGRTSAEGEWYLNTAATSLEDNDFSEAIVDELSKDYCIDQDRLYGIGYSLGSMYTYEIAPIATLIESTILSRMAELADFGTSQGTLTTGGSNGNMLGMLCARQAKLPLSSQTGFDGSKMVAFVSEESHYSFNIASNVIGIGQSNLIKVRCNEHGQMRPDSLEDEIQRAVRNGFTPFAVLATSGTTVKGSFDPLRELASVAHKHDLWMHVDAAWGG